MRLNILNKLLRCFEKPKLRKQTIPAAARVRFERQARTWFQSPPYARYTTSRLGSDVPVTWAGTGSSQPEGVILYIHGGAHVMGSAQTHQHMLAHIAGRLGWEAVLPDYRLAPEHPFPAGKNDIVSCYESLLNKGYHSDQIVLGGDSSGGGMMFALLAHICVNDLPRPLGAFSMSPWLDLTCSAPSLAEFKSADALLSVDTMPLVRDMYLQGAPVDDPYASPLLARYPGCPAVLLHAGSREILRDDTLNMQNHLLSERVQVTCRIWDDTPHVWHMFAGYIPEAQDALDDIADFISSL